MNNYTIPFLLSILIFSFCVYHNQERMQVKIKLDPDAQIPLHGTNYSAGYDLYSIENTFIYPHGYKLVRTGVSLEVLSHNCYIRIEERSSLAKKEVIVMAGIIDQDYRGEIGVLLKNLSPYKFEIKKGDRIGQMIFQKFYYVDFLVTTELTKTARGENGFGSTGI